MTDGCTLLVDTNVWLDRFMPRRPRFALAKELFDFCVREEVTLLFPMHALNDVFYQVSRDGKAWLRESYGVLPERYVPAITAQAWSCVEGMLEVGAPVGADVSDVWVAQHLRDIHGDFEDDMVLAAAERARVDYLVTSDQRLIQKATVAALAPQDMLAVLRLRAGKGAQA